MKTVTFRGGIHPRYSKELSSGEAVRRLEAPAEVAIPLSQHIGAPALPCVEKGDEVLLGQVVGEPGGFVSSAVHSPVSGKVKAVERRPGPIGASVECVVIENDGEDRRSSRDGLGDAWPEAAPGALKERVQAAGIVGMGGAAFPTQVKLSPPQEKPIDTVILNGAECEPYLTADHRLMLERPEAVLTGLEIVVRILGAGRGLVGVEVNKPDAIEALGKAAEGRPVEIVPLEIKYPQGAEKQLIDACLGRRVPSGGLPMDVGVVVQNVGTAAAVTEAVVEGSPLVERVVTVTGEAVSRPANLRVRIGTPIAFLLEACGGLKDDVGKLILGGPMMGFAVAGAELPVTKGTSGVLALREEQVSAKPPGPCIRCGRCGRVCPMRLVPTDIAVASARGEVERAERADAMDCIECGSCAFDCPAGIPLVQHIRLAKGALLAKRRGS
jgi:Na+-translocating ferredoxin:NAD+ oxidoreductase subunit C